ncbi:hypothetical protein [Chryseobacterium sp. CT-SW4]|uniref:hypothetical protein n=1 Tax=Chryseobacterium sp. SW-1 TaxID=3157343 RepID=UPI003B016C3D
MIKIIGKYFSFVSVQALLFRLLSLLALLPISAWSQIYLGEGAQVTISEGTFIRSGEGEVTKISSVDSQETDKARIYIVEGTKVSGQFSAAGTAKIVYQDKSLKKSQKVAQTGSSSKKQKGKLVKGLKKEKEIQAPAIPVYCDKGENKAYYTSSRSFSAVVINNTVSQLASFADYQYKIVKHFIERKIKFSSYCFLIINKKQNFDYTRRGPPFLHYMI